MCHWLTLAAATKRSLDPLLPLGVTLESTPHPALPSSARTLQRFLVTAGDCACGLLGEHNAKKLTASLEWIVQANPIVLAHRTYGDRPTGGREAAPLEPCGVFDFVSDDHSRASDRWVRLVRDGTPSVRR